MKAHDVRHLRLCGYCGSIGDRRDMLQLPAGLVHGRANAKVAKGDPVEPGPYHGLCVVETLTHEEILALPHVEFSKLRMNEAGPVLMRKLLDAQ